MFIRPPRQHDQRGVSVYSSFIGPTRIGNRFLASIIFLLALFLVNSCIKVGPDYIPPKVRMANGWHAPLKGSLASDKLEPQALADWWKKFNDPQFSNLMDRAVRGNLDLKKARARIREARAYRGVSKAGLFPTLNGTGSATWNYSNRDTELTRTPNSLYSASFDAGWEIDLFGGVRRSIEAADGNLQASIEDLRDVLVSLLAEVAINYIEARTYQARIAVAKTNLVAQDETYQLTLWRYQSGLSDELPVEQAQYNLESTRSQIPTLYIGLEAAINRISVLLGEQPGKLHQEIEKELPIPVPPIKVAVGVPADIIRRRPDIRRAEWQLAAQTAKIGVATADLYPKFTLNGSIGLEAFSSSNVLTISGGPRISWAIFKAGAIRQNIEIQSALQEQALFTYEAAILSALEEVENILVSYAQEQERRESLAKATQAAQKAVELAQHKHQAGLMDFNSVLDAQRSLLSFQDQLVKSEGTVTSNVVRLFKALGGGWKSLSLDKNNTGDNNTGDGEKK